MASRVKRFRPDELRRLEKQRDRLESEIAKIDLFSAGLKTEFWKAVEDRIRPELARCETGLDKFEQLPERDIIVLLTKRQAYRGFLDIKSYIRTREMLESALAAKRERISEYNERNETE